MRFTQTFLILFATIHLSLAWVGAMGKETREWPIVGGILSTYAAYTGLNNSFGFFAPGVGSQLRLRFELQLVGGGTRMDTLTSGISHEAELRIDNTVQAFGEKVQDASVRRSLAASWAGKILARHAQAKAVKVILESYELPSREQFAKGDRPRWVSFYSARFARPL